MRLASLIRRMMVVCVIASSPLAASEAGAALDPVAGQMEKLSLEFAEWPNHGATLSLSGYLVPADRQAGQAVVVASMSDGWRNSLKKAQQFAWKIGSSIGTGQTQTNAAGRRRRAQAREADGSDATEKATGVVYVVPDARLVPVPLSRPVQEGRAMTRLLTSKAMGSTNLSAADADVAMSVERELAKSSHLYSGGILAGFLLLLCVVAGRWWYEARRLKNRLIAKQAIYDDISRLPPAGDARQAAIRQIVGRIENVLGFRAASFMLVQRESWHVCNLDAGETVFHVPRGLPEELIATIRASRDEPRMLWRCSGDGQDMVWAAYDEVRAHKPDAVGCFVGLDENFAVLFSAHCLAGSVCELIDNRTPYLMTRLVASTLRGTSAQSESAAAGWTVPAIQDDRALAGRIAHEFNNVLTSITGYAEMAADGLKPGSSTYGYVEHIQATGQRARQIVDHILDSGRSRRTRVVPFDVVAATRDILPDIQMVIPRSTKFQASLPQNALYVSGDPLELQRAVTNLCKNAGEAVKDGGSITLSISMLDYAKPRPMRRGKIRAGRYVSISVEDTGSGIADGAIQRIFDPFFTTRRGDGGTGLGLPMVCDFVENLRGALDVRSRPNRGTRFDLYLPVAPLHRQKPCAGQNARQAAFGVSPA